VDADSWRLDARALAPGQTVKVRLRRRGGQSVEGFAVNHVGTVSAYVNACPHAGNPLDLRDEHFLSDDGRLLRCSVHGAVFAPDTGVCLEGPCPGARLERLAVARDGDVLVITCPT
jgi:nitrite reductase/ring-hydroxylating ferredoxin subunit